MNTAKQTLPWHQHYWELFSAYVTQQRIPQALLITGNKGLGKKYLAVQFAQSLLCEHPDDDGFYCGRCHSCNLFNAQTHPDYLALQPEETGKNITINQIRGLINDLSLKPQYPGNRVVIIHPAEQLNKAAANGFLKCLEEPAERTLIILVTEKPASLPATILSRCQKMIIERPVFQVAVEWLQHQNIDENIPDLVNLAQGAPLLAQQYAEQQTLALRKKCFQSWILISRKQISPLAVAEEWQNISADQLLQWLISWVADMAKLHYQKQPLNGYNSDLTQSLRELVQGIELKKLFDYYELLLQSRHHVETQLNKQMLFEEILLNWSQLNT